MNTSTPQKQSKRLIGLVGPAGAGKDTVAELIHDMSRSCFVIVDVRTEPEVDAIHAQGGVIWRVERPGVAPVREHVSESGTATIRSDCVILNDGTLDELRAQVGAELARLNYEQGMLA